MGLVNIFFIFCFMKNEIVFLFNDYIKVWVYDLSLKCFDKYIIVNFMIFLGKINLDY